MPKYDKKPEDAIGALAKGTRLSVQFLLKSITNIPADIYYNSINGINYAKKIINQQDEEDAANKITVGALMVLAGILSIPVYIISIPLRIVIPMVAIFIGEMTRHYLDFPRLYDTTSAATNDMKTRAKEMGNNIIGKLKNFFKKKETDPKKEASAEKTKVDPKKLPSAEKAKVDPKKSLSAEKTSANEERMPVKKQLTKKEISNRFTGALNLVFYILYKVPSEYAANAEWGAYGLWEYYGLYDSSDRFKHQRQKIEDEYYRLFPESSKSAGSGVDDSYNIMSQLGYDGNTEQEKPERKLGIGTGIANYVFPEMVKRLTKEELTME